MPASKQDGVKSQRFPHGLDGRVISKANYFKHKTWGVFMSNFHIYPFKSLVYQSTQCLVQGQVTLCHPAAACALYKAESPSCPSLWLHHSSAISRCFHVACTQWTIDAIIELHTLVLEVASSGNENCCQGLLTGARVFALGARARFRAACWNLNCSLTSAASALQSG